MSETLAPQQPPEIDQATVPGEQLDDITRARETQIEESFALPVLDYPETADSVEKGDKPIASTTARHIGQVATPLSPFSGKPMKLPAESAEIANRTPRELTSEEKAEYGLPEDYQSPSEATPVSRMQRGKEEEASWNDRKANLDSGLTWLPNRKALAERFEENEIDSVEGVAMVDLNKFKALNDEYGGHDVGDTGLKMFAGLLQEKMSGVGTAYRTGGDEFVLVFDKGTDPESIKLAIKEITTGAKSIIFPKTPTPDETDVWDHGASVGYVSSSEAHSLEEGLKLADEKMYRQKNGLSEEEPVPDHRDRLP